MSLLRIISASFSMPGCMRMSSVGVILRTIFSAYEMGSPIFVTLSTRASGRELREICVSRFHQGKSRGAIESGVETVKTKKRSPFFRLSAEKRIEKL